MGGEGFDTAEAGRQQGGHVGVAAILAEQGLRVPQNQVGLGGPRQGRVGGEQGTPRDVADDRLRGRTEESGGTTHLG